MKRVIIEDVSPQIDCGVFPIKRIVGENVTVRASIYADGHDLISSSLLYHGEKDKTWNEVPMKEVGKDLWEATFWIHDFCSYKYTVKGFVNHFLTWQQDLKKKFDANQYIMVDILIGCNLIKSAARNASAKEAKLLKQFAQELENEKDLKKALLIAANVDLTLLMNKYADQAHATIYEKELKVLVSPKKAGFSSWYEVFPRSCSPQSNRSGTFNDVMNIIPEIANMGFTILYFPPIHPIGKTNRKGKNNTEFAHDSDPGCPWAIGSDLGGHMDIDPSLGTINDFEEMVRCAKDNGLDIAMDLAFHCSPDHPYITQHPQWFTQRPDGSIQHAENPPKKYEDIVHFNFANNDYLNLWEELKKIALYWIAKGITIFRADNPHTKPFLFWEWFLPEIYKEYPETIFLSEAFTRPRIMKQLSKIGFTQSYTYFTWRNTKHEITSYLTELTQTEMKEHFRPNFWTNTPDILSEYLQYGGRPAFIIRLILAATLSSNYGIYGPVYELFIDKAISGDEEYLDSEKYEIKHWDFYNPGSLKGIITRINAIRKQNPCLHKTNNILFCETDNESLLFYIKYTKDFSNILLIAVNLDPSHTQSANIILPLDKLQISKEHQFLVHDLLTDHKYIWQGEKNHVELNPQIIPAHIFEVKKTIHDEKNYKNFS